MRNEENYLKPIIGTGNQGSILCGTVKYTLSCGHHDHAKQFVYHNCGNPDCPDCYRYWVSRACDRILPTLTAIYNKLGFTSESDSKIVSDYQTLSKHKYSHWVVSLPTSNLKDSPFDYLDKLRKLNLYGVVIYHPYRHSEEGKTMIKELRSRGWVGGSWDIWRESGLYSNPDTIVFSPHLHIVSVGYIPRGLQLYYRSQGIVIKKVRDIGYEEEEIRKVVAYQLSHCAYCGKSKSYRYLGLKRSVHVVIDSEWSKPVPLYCPDCGEVLHRYINDGDTLIDDGICYESHKIYHGYIYIGCSRASRVARASELTSMLTSIMNKLKQKEDYYSCINQEKLSLYC